ncbi:TcpD family membrane protein [Bacillus arachidis]|uniref:TcpD family membrane protein n=1 Tax=Bacillus arachidis TaxID=2819290 RepID=UPI00255D14F6|nr:TcpD family membrane protein [Bacillus arachidis]WIY59030.1 TcpD family membrane protein [Bacillus arachidis]
MYMLEMMNSLVLGIGLEGVLETVKTQGTYALYCAFIIVALILAAKRAWGLVVTLVVGGGMIAFFINKPDALKAIGTWLGGLAGM